jgi:hypothetical protein
VSAKGTGDRRPDEIDPQVMRWCISLALAALVAGTLMNIVTLDSSHSCAPGESRFTIVAVGKGLSIATLVSAVVLAILQQTGKLSAPPRTLAYVFLGLAATTTALSLGVIVYLGSAGDPVCAPF